MWIGICFRILVMNSMIMRPCISVPLKRKKTKDHLFYYVSENVTTRVFLFPENLKYRKLKKNLINHVVSNSDWWNHHFKSMNTKKFKIREYFPAVQKNRWTLIFSIFCKKLIKWKMENIKLLCNSGKWIEKPLEESMKKSIFTKLLRIFILNSCLHQIKNVHWHYKLDYWFFLSECQV